MTIEEPPKTKKKILIIDDDVLIRETVKIALEHEGFEVQVAPDGKRAFERVRGEKPDLIVLDLYMPGMNGWEFCRSLKGDPETKDIPVMIFTGSNETVDVVSGLEAGAFEYITKPVDGDLLVKKIKKKLELMDRRGS